MLKTGVALALWLLSSVNLHEARDTAIATAGFAPVVVPPDKEAVLKVIGL